MIIQISFKLSQPSRVSGRHNEARNFLMFLYVEVHSRCICGGVSIDERRLSAVAKTPPLSGKPPPHCPSCAWTLANHIKPLLTLQLPQNRARAVRPANTTNALSVFNSENATLIVTPAINSICPLQINNAKGHRRTSDSWTRSISHLVALSTP